ncbi:MAG: hypothetical protein Q9169_000909 [Polycauliona sp. 2 TL-2023]
MNLVHTAYRSRAYRIWGSISTTWYRGGLRWTARVAGQPRYQSQIVRGGRPFRMAVLGSGPAGFYTAYKVMQGIDDAKVDMYEHLPVPFGLVRYGVAPDHPEVKNCQDKFTEVASSPNFTFIGNINVGQDLALKSLANQYDAVVFAYGASKDRKLGIPGEDQLNGIYSARDFVGWYNGLPEFSKLAPRLDLDDTAVVIGQGNVALDVARMLLKDVDSLRKTDITEHALASLAKSRVKRVHVVGRRGPMQVSCTIKEVRELMKLPSVAFEPIDQNLIPPNIQSLPRTAKRMTKLLMEGSINDSTRAEKSWALDFLLSPVQFLPAGGTTQPQLESIEFARTKLVGNDPFDPGARIQVTEDHQSITTSLAFRSIGYQSEALPGMTDLGIHFDLKRGIITNDYHGRLLHEECAKGPLRGMYCAGWVKRGPAGVIANTMEDSFGTAEAIIADWNNKTAGLGGGDGWEALKRETTTKGVRTVSWTDWLRIDAAEKARGKAVGKEREKFTNPSDMLNVVGAGAVGLAIARKLAEKDGTSTLLIERHGSAGTETSSRNSEVIHAGIYYGPDSLKTELCLQGKRMMYDLCERQGIPYRNCKKWVLAQDNQQHEQLDKTCNFAKSIGVPVQFISVADARQREPDVYAANAVLESPTTGIIDSHSYMSYLELDFQSRGGDLAFHTRLDAIDTSSNGYEIHTTSPSGESASITAETLINSAGLHAVPLSNSILPPERHIKPYYAKGSYYSYSAPHPRPKTLIYPAPTTGAAGLGTHLTMDMTGAIRFGPDVEWVDDPTDLSVNEERLSAALDEIQSYLPNIDRKKVMLDYAGIRPKLGKGSAVASGQGDGFSDFYIKREEGFEGFINLLGIESPGLTSSIGISEKELRYQILSRLQIENEKLFEDGASIRSSDNATGFRIALPARPVTGARRTYTIETLKASSALLKHISSESKRKAATSSTKNLLNASLDTSDQDENLDVEPVWFSLTTKKHIVDKHRLKPGKIALPHSLNQSPSTTICLITCDPQRQVKDTIAHPSFPTALSSRITKVIGLSKLKARYQSFESRRQLLNDHDVFLADDRVITMLPKVLGKVFYQSHKKPVPVSLEPYKQTNAAGKRVVPKAADEKSKTLAPPLQVAKEVEKTINCALVHLSPANNTAVRVGYSSFTAQQIAENVEAVVAGLVERFIPQKWRNIRAVHIKGPNTMALPIWLADELWVDEADVLEKQEEKAIGLKSGADPGGKKRKESALVLAADGDDGRVSKRARGEEATNGEKKKRRRVEETDLSTEMRERREKLREQKRLNKADMQGLTKRKADNSIEA